MQTVNLTVGGGIFALPAAVAALLGPSAILAYVVCGALMLLVLLCFAEVGSRVTRTGGAIAYIEDAFGPYAGFLAWALLALGYTAAADAAIANVMVDSLGVLVPPLATPAARIALLLGVFGGVAWVNVRGVRQGMRVSIVTTAAKLVPLLLLLVFGFAALQRANLVIESWPAPSRVGEAALILFFAFSGSESGVTASGEIRDPRRTVPRGLVLGMVFVVLLFVALQTVAQGVLGPALATATAAPLAAVGERLLGPAGRTMILACTALAIFGTIAADFVGAPRMFVAAAESRTISGVFGRVHPLYRTPHVSIVAFAVLAATFAVTGGFRLLAVFASLALLLVYLGVCLAALRMRALDRRVGDAAADGFRAPGGSTVGVLACAVVLWLIAQSTWREAVAVAVLLALASLYYALCMRSRLPRHGNDVGHPLRRRRGFRTVTRARSSDDS